MEEKNKDNNFIESDEAIFDEDELAFIEISKDKYSKDILENNKKDKLKDKFNW